MSELDDVSLRLAFGRKASPFGVVAWSPDGRRIAAAGGLDDLDEGVGDGLIWVWTLGDSEPWLLRGHSNYVTSIAWSPDGASVVSGSADHTVRVWDAALGRERYRLEGHSGSVLSVAWSPDGASVASGSRDNSVQLWDATLGRARHRLEGHLESVLSVAWSPDGASVASWSADHTVRLWDAALGRECHRLEGHAGDVRSVAWSPDGATVASGSDDNTVRLWDAAAGRERHRLKSHSVGVQSVAWSPDGATVASGSDDNTVRLWDAAAGREGHRLEGHSQSVTSVVWSPDGASVVSGSDDKTVRLWDAALGRERHRLEGHTSYVQSVAWSPDGATVASGSYDGSVRLWDSTFGCERHRLEGHASYVQSVAWSPDGATVASGSDDNTVRLWDAALARWRLTLEGHQAPVGFLAWSADSQSLASVSRDGEIRVWDPNGGDLLGQRDPLPFWQSPAGIEFGPGRGGFETEALTVIVWTPARSELSAAPQILQASAKVIFAGDSDAGKTCLARRLVEDMYESGQSSTHGMQIWNLAPEKLHASGAAPTGQSREIFLWDLGGQSEYQLVNQAFIHDSTVALVLFDAARGTVGLQSADAWNQRLTSRANPSIRKLLIRSKADLAGIVSQSDVEDLRERLGFAKYIEVSAEREHDAGVAELREALHNAIDWDNIAMASRPAASQHIRDSLAEMRQSGICVTYLDELVSRLQREKVVFTPGELDTTLGHLSPEGQIVDLRLQSGDRVIVLRIDVLSQYAGSIVQAARNNERGVPVMEQSRILSAGMNFPGLEPEERLRSRGQEKTVLESAVRLMIERGICFDHQGLLIFPTLFDERAPHEGTLPPSAPIYYDFSGPIDNIYASLVARLVVSGRFGPVRLWARYAEFGQSTGGSFGLRRADSTGRGHLDLYFDEASDVDLRKLFRDFVNDHLTSEGVKVLSGLAFTCRICQNEFSESDIRFRLAKNAEYIRCQRCETSYSLFAAAETPTPEGTKALLAFKTDLEERTRASEQKVAATMARPHVVEAGAPLRILHLSDLHFRGETRTDSVLQPIYADLRYKLKIERLDYIVVSGDFADRCNPAGFDAAREFIQELAGRFEVTPLKTILVPGNHDYERRQEHFTWAEWKPGAAYEDGFKQGEVVFAPSEKYAERFDPFRRFYHSFYSTQEYPQDPSRQFEVIKDAETGLHFLCLNSAWKVDQFRPERALVNNDALSSALMKAGSVRLGILVWHHAVAGDRKVADTKAIKRLGEAGFRVLLHGDVHEDRDDVLDYLDPKRRIHVVGGGSFGSGDRPESTPRLYSLLEVARDLSDVRVYRRQQKSADGEYGAYAIYAVDAYSNRGDYRIDF